jgi:type IV pilus assembly protein PilY1
MNKRFASNDLSLIVSAIGLGLMLLGPDALAQTIDDYAAEPPFSSAESNSVSGSISTTAAVEPSGLGTLYQASYYKSYTDSGTGKILDWGGMLHAIFIDESGRFREDNGIKGKLEDTSIDYVVQMFTDTAVAPARTRFRRFAQTGSGLDASLNPVGAVAEIATLNAIWSAENTLAGINQNDLVIQRSLDASGHYAEDAANRRFVFTYLDVPGQDTTGEVDAGEVIDFVADTFDPDINSNWRYLGLADPGDAMNFVNYVRGQDIPGWRNRLINLPGDDSDLERYWILGDIVNSAPLVVNSPQESYDLLYGDTTYQDFKTQYAHRRQMIYVGANDGMLHAFNGGIWNSAERSLQTAADADGSAQDHQLGAEMWAYVPMNLLPHLQWLTSVDYPHVYFVDGSAQSFDVNIFADDAIHPGGWGTILVTGMRFGGSKFDLDLDADGNAETTRTSAVIVMDITDPEKAPTLLAELARPGLGFTTGAPTVIKARRPDAAGSYASPAMNEWLLVFGSGPEDLATATSTMQRPTLFAWDLVAGNYIDLSENSATPATESAGFYGSLTSVDQNNDYIDDVLYAGTVEGTEQAPAGRLKRLLLNAAAPAFGLADGTAHLRTLLDVGKPIVAKPAFIHSYTKNENWLLFGTGRSFTVNDYLAVFEQGLFGVKDSGEDDAVELSSLIDATDIIVQTDALSGNQLVWDSQVNNALFIDDVALDTFDDLFAFMDNKNGWYKNLRVEQAAERVVTNALLLRSAAIFTTFLPEPVGNQKAGESFIHTVNYRTGTADAAALLGSDTAGVLRDSVSAGEKELAEPMLYVTQGNDTAPAQIGSTQSDAQVGSNISLMAGTDDGNQKRIDFAMPPTTLKRISWEFLEQYF